MIFLGLTRRPNLPAAANREHYVIGMDLRVALYELDTRGVLPMAHGQFEKRLMDATEVAIDLVRNHPIVPDAFLFGGDSTGHPMTQWLLILGRSADGGGRCLLVRYG